MKKFGLLQHTYFTINKEINHPCSGLLWTLLVYRRLDIFGCKMIPTIHPGAWNYFKHFLPPDFYLQLFRLRINFVHLPKLTDFYREIIWDVCTDRRRVKGVLWMISFTIPARTGRSVRGRSSCTGAARRGSPVAYQHSTRTKAVFPVLPHWS